MSAEIEPLVVVVATDLSAITRGRAVPASRFDKVAKAGVGWLQANISLTPFNGIADPNPWGSRGDLRLVPDPKARFRTDLTGSATAFDIAMGDIVELDGTPWPACPRAALRGALADLKAETGFDLIAGFEQEFALFGETLTNDHSLSLAALRSVDPFGPQLVSALSQAGVEPDVFIAEFGRNQFEITCAPSSAVLAADRAIVIREVTRELARNLKFSASFTPKTAPDAVGAGLHIHFSFADGAMFDAAQPGRLSKIAGAFCAGVIEHLPALILFTAPSPVSYLRLRPHAWSASWTSLADRDREAALRICPTTSLNGAPSRQFNVEFRAADGTCNPYMALAAIIRAGLDGVRRALPTPPLIEGDPEAMDEAQRRMLGLRRLPNSLPAAIEAFKADAAAQSWFAADLNESLLGVRKAELARVANLDPAGICELYRTLY